MYKIIFVLLLLLIVVPMKAFAQNRNLAFSNTTYSYAETYEDEDTEHMSGSKKRDIIGGLVALSVLLALGALANRNNTKDSKK